MKTPKFRLFAPTFAAIPVAMVSSMLLSSPSASAASGTWDNLGSGWTNTTNWTPDGGPQLSSTGSNTDIATFGNSGSGFNAVDLSSSRTVLGLNFTSGANVYTFASANGKQLDVMGTGITNNSTALQTFNLVVNNAGGDGLVSSIAGGSLLFNSGYNLTSSSSTSNRTVTVSGAGTVTFASAIANGGMATTGKMTVTSTGTTIFSGSNTYDGLTTMNAAGGTLTLSGDNSGAAGGVIVTAGTVNVNNVNALGSGVLTTAVGGVINNTSGAALVNAGNNAILWAGITTSSAQAGFTFGTTASTAANNLNLGSGTVTATTSRSMSFAGTGTTLSMGILDSTSTTTGRAFNFDGANNTMVLAGIKLSNAASANVTDLLGTANLTVTGVVSNGTSNVQTGVAVKGTGITTFNGANTYTGSTAISSGATLKIGHDSALGTNAGGTSVSSGGVLDINGRTVGAETLSLAGSGISSAGALINSNASAASLSGAVILTSNTTIGAGNITLGSIGDASAAKSLTKIGTGKLSLGGTNSYTGGTTIQDGTLEITAGNSAVGLFTLQSASASAPILKLSNVNALSTTATLRGAAGSADAGTLDMAVAGSYSLAAYTGQNMKFTASSGSATTLTFTGDSAVSTGNNGSKTITNTDSNLTIAFAGNLDISSSTGGTVTVTGAGNTSVAGALTNTGSATRGLEKSGAGTLTLSGTNSYNGATNVNAGKLVINGNSSTSTGNVSVATGATLGGSGLLGGATSVTGTLDPGNSIESLGLGALSFVTGSTYAYELNSSSLAGDLTYSSGGLNIAAGSILTLTELFSGILASSSKLTLISSVGAWDGGLFTYNSSTLADGSEIVLGSNTWKFDYNDTSGGSNYSSDQGGAANFVTMTVIPEPNVAMLVGGLGVLALLRRRNR